MALIGEREKRERGGTVVFFFSLSERNRQDSGREKEIPSRFLAYSSNLTSFHPAGWNAKLVSVGVFFFFFPSFLKISIIDVVRDFLICVLLEHVPSFFSLFFFF